MYTKTKGAQTNGPILVLVFLGKGQEAKYDAEYEPELRPFKEYKRYLLYNTMDIL